MTLNSYHFREKSEPQALQHAPKSEVPDFDSCPENFDTDEAMKLYNVHPRSLKDCFDMFAEIPSCVDDLPALERITYEALQDFADHSVAYLELRSTPKRLLYRSDRLLDHGRRVESNCPEYNEYISSNNEGTSGTGPDPVLDRYQGPKFLESNLASKEEYIATILRVMHDFEEKETLRWRERRRQAESDMTDQRVPLRCRLLVAMDRSQSLEEANENVDLAIEFFRRPSPRIVGIDLGGNPTKKDFREFASVAQRARDAGLRVTIHCAEVPSDEGKDWSDEDGATNSDETTQTNRQRFLEAQSILQFGPDRLGHALLLPPSLYDVLRERRIPVETCPTSNVMTLELSKRANGSLLHGLKQHPNLNNWLKDRHPIAVGTDDPGVFDTTPTQELLLLSKAFGLSETDIANLVLRSMEFAFCDLATKEEVLHDMQRRTSYLTSLLLDVRDGKEPSSRAEQSLEIFNELPN